MPISALRKLLRRIRRKSNLASPEPTEVISESEEVNNMNEQTILNEETDESETLVNEATEEIESDTEVEATADSSGDNRSHLVSNVPRAVKSPVGAMSSRELREARELFSNMDDAEIQRLYKRVTG